MELIDIIKKNYLYLNPTLTETMKAKSLGMNELEDHLTWPTEHVSHIK